MSKMVSALRELIVLSGTRWHIGSYEMPEPALATFLASGPGLGCWGRLEEPGLCGQ